jgi:ribosomal protein RSM22 (predicted rRNA methylase)
LYDYSIQSINWARILSNPLKKSGHTIFSLCSNDGEIKNRYIITKDDPSYKFSRKSFWRDLFPFVLNNDSIKEKK